MKHEREIEVYRVKIGDILNLIDGSKAVVSGKGYSRDVEVTNLETGEVDYIHGWGFTGIYLKAANVPKAHTDEHVEKKSYDLKRMPGLSGTRNRRLFEANTSKAAERHEDLLYLYDD